MRNFTIVLAFLVSVSPLSVFISDATSHSTFPSGPPSQLPSSPSILPPAPSASSSLDCGSNGICVPTYYDLGIEDRSVGFVLTEIALFVTSVIAVLAVLAIVVSGVMYIVSAGNSSTVELAKNTLVYAVGGLVLSLLAWVIVTVISAALGAG